jgi:hypothetical protein
MLAIILQGVWEKGTRESNKPNRDEVAGVCRKLYNEGLHNL